MNGSALRSVLRHAVARSRDAAALADAELVRRFAATGDDAAFAALVGRHGPMVWGVCRNLLADDADADDAFQATFLTLMRSAAGVRDHGSLAGWLHRVAYRVTMKARRTATRRRRRERVAAVGEAVSAVADSAWDHLLGAVHEEVNRLPDSLRIPFVLCCLEGRRVTDAAAALDLKLGTVSGRLTKAKQRILDRLARRGLPASAAVGAVGLAAATSSAAVPSAILDHAVALPGAAGAIPPAVLQLSLGVMEMKFTRTILAGAVLVVAGLLATGVGPALVPWASAQSDPKAADPAAVQTPRKVSGKWEYAYVEVPRPVTESAFESACRNMEPEGWEYSGTQEMTLERRSGAGGAPKRGPQLVLVFKRPVSARRVDGYHLSGADRRGDLADADAKARIEALEDQLKARRTAAEIDKERTLYALRLQQMLLGDKAAARDLLAKKDAQAAAQAAADDLAKKLDAATRDRELLLKNKPDAPGGDDRLPIQNRTAAADAWRGDAKRIAATITIIPLGDGNAEKMAKMLTDLFGHQGTFQADDRSNSLVIKADAQTLAEIHQLIERLEKQAQAKKERDLILKDREKLEREKNVRP